MRLHLAAAAAVLALAATAVPVHAAPPTKQMEDLDRGLISVRSGSGNLVSWRLLGTDPDGVTFNLYRGSARIASGLATSTNYLDDGAAADSSYTVRAVTGGAEQPASPASRRFTGGAYLDVPIQPPQGGTTPDGVGYTYSANDAACGRHGRRRHVRTRAQVGPVQRQGQLPVRLHRQRVRGRLPPRRHPPVAHRPGPQHPGLRPLHPVPGVRLRRRRPGRGGDEDRRRHQGRPRRRDRQFERRSPQLQRVRAQRPRIPDHVQRPDRRRAVHGRLRPAARHGLLLGRQLRQPGGSFPGRDGVPGRRASFAHHGPRLLHPQRHRRLGLPQRLADQAVDVRQQLGRPPSTPTRAATACRSATSTATAATRSSTARWP